MARKILLADDSVTAQNMGRKILADAGYEVLTVNNGSTALKKIAELKPDLVVLDVYMPGYSGLEVCSRLRESPETARMPVLLTVGKLEPFKPEEARRVQADAFIVKPFEASELLSALAKLEDKIVPRSEAAKPGRMTRSGSASASAAEGSARDKSAGSTEKDWKSRIGFPARKDEKLPEEPTDDSAIYNPVNRDLRTVVDAELRTQKTAAEPTGDKKESKREVAALLPAELAGSGHDLPKEVTPEEIAAFAAAAAKVEATLAERRNALPVEAQLAPADASPKIEAGRPEEAHPEEAKVKVAEVPEQITETASAGTSLESHPDKDQEAVGKLPGDVQKDGNDVAVVNESPIEASTFAERVQARLSANTLANDEDVESRAQEEVLAAVATLEPANLPVTMAAGNGGDKTGSPRWAAISVALSPEESGISLEQEMQKAFGVAAGAEKSFHSMAVAETQAHGWRGVDSSSPSGAGPNGPGVESEIAGEVRSDFEAPSGEDKSASGEFTPEATTVTETLNTALGVESKDGAKAEEPKIDQESIVAIGDSDSEIGGHCAPQMAAADGGEQPGGQAQIESRNATVSLTSEETELSGSTIPARDEAASQAEVSSRAGESQQADVTGESSEPTIVAAVGVAPKTHLHETRFDGRAVAYFEQAPMAADAAGGSEDMAAKKESELAASTAAAWANWRQIRETSPNASAGEPEKAESKESSSTSSSSSERSSSERSSLERSLSLGEAFEPVTPPAAMAVAAGAEKTPQEAAGSSDVDPSVLASMVDTMLAELRPKLVEEISRKLAASKK